MILEIITLKLKVLFIPCEENKYRPKFLTSNFLYYYAILLLILKISIIPFFAFFPNNIFFADINEATLVELVNQTRAYFGLHPLRVNPLLENTAYLKVNDMFKNDYFAHNSPRGITPWFWFQKAGYNYKFAGENLAIGFLDSAQVHQAWLDSPSHRNIILSPNYNEIGIAVLKGEFQGKEVPIVVQHFGTLQPEVKAMEKELTLPEVPKVSIEKPIEKIEEPKKEALPIKERKVETEAESEIKTEKEIVVQRELNETGEVLAAFQEPGDKNNFSFKLLSFLASDYYTLLQRIIYGSLILILFSLFITIFFDLFIYRAFEIQYKDIVLKAICFSVLFLIFLSIDKNMMIQFIPHDLRIY